MKVEIEKKLDKIAKIWSNFIWKYKFCTLKIQFTDDVRTNYFSDIEAYFVDTLDVVFIRREEKSYSDKFANAISLLQAIYIHQDLIEELLFIFKCQVDKGDLKSDRNYFLNRDIRNELVGHPIRKREVQSNASIQKCNTCGNSLAPLKGKLALMSSITFAYNSNKDTILYLRYHRDNNFEMEKISHNVIDVIDRHCVFLNTYLDRILDKLKVILSEFSERLDNIERLLVDKDFETVVKVIEVHFENIFKSDYAYEKHQLLEIYKERKEHIRYQNFIDKFVKDLKSQLTETKENITSLFTEKESHIERIFSELPFFNNDKSHIEKIIDPKIDNTINYHYELGKLATNRAQFDIFSKRLRAKCLGNDLVLQELDHMQLHVYNDIEYYSSHRFICTILGENI